MSVKIEASRQSLPTWSAQPPAAVDAPHFSELLNPRDAAAGRTAQSDSQKVRQASQQLVSSTLILPLLAQIRKDPFRSELFHGGQAEEMFHSQLDQKLADRITSRANLPIVEAVSRSIMQKAGQLKNKRGESGAAPSRLNVHG